MKKVLDYGVFARTIGAVMTDTGARNKAQALQELKAEYPPEKGWEIVGTAYLGSLPEGWTFAWFLQQVEYA